MGLVTMVTKAKYGIDGEICLRLFFVCSVVVFVCSFWLYTQSEDFNTSSMTAVTRKIALDFEVFGRVQGVFFRKGTQSKSNELGLRGWCMNTAQNTVKGEIQGEPRKVQEMKHWLSKVGSPGSRIEKAEFKNEREISDYTFSNFSIKK